MQSARDVSYQPGCDLGGLSRKPMLFCFGYEILGILALRKDPVRTAIDSVADSVTAAFHSLEPQLT